MELLTLNSAIVEKLAIGFIGLLGGLLMYWVKSFFEDRHKRTEETKTDLKETKDKQDKEFKEILKLMSEMKDDLQHNHNTLKDSLNETEKRNIKEHAEVFAKIGTMGHQVTQCMESISEMKGRLNDQITLGSSHISTIGHMSRQIDALFRAIDAQKRATDGCNVS